MVNLTTLRKNSKQILGLNARYLGYIRPHNKASAFDIADNKIATKLVCQKNEIPVPEMLAKFDNLKELEDFDFSTLPKSFVVKPVRGTKGGGIEIFYNKDKEGNWIKSNGKRVSLDELKNHCGDIIDGKYSMFSQRDTVLIEERIKPHKAFRYYTYKGTPDVRVIVFNNMPVMAMLRLPTERSQGKANLDLGGIGVGIDLAVGKTTNSISGKKGFIEFVPGTQIPLSGLKIPQWDKLLEYAVKAANACKLGFGGIDILIDNEKGPLIIEVNARPGLSIQLANDEGLQQRLKKATDIKVRSIEKGIRLSKDLFGGEIEEEIEAISGKQVVGLIENVKLVSKDGKTIIPRKAKIDTGATITSIDTNLAIELGFGDAIHYAESIMNEIPKNFTDLSEIKRVAKEEELNKKLEEHPDIIGTAIIKQSNGINYRISVNCELQISGITLNAKATIMDRTNLSYKVLIGARDLKKFLVDPSKK